MFALNTTGYEIIGIKVKTTIIPRYTYSLVLIKINIELRLPKWPSSKMGTILKNNHSTRSCDTHDPGNPSVGVINMRNKQESSHISSAFLSQSLVKHFFTLL